MNTVEQHVNSIVEQQQLEFITKGQAQAESLISNVSYQVTLLACFAARPDWILQAASSVPSDLFIHGQCRAVFDTLKNWAFAAQQNGWTIRFDPNALIDFETAQGRGEQFMQATHKYDILYVIQQRAAGPGFNADQIINETLHHLRDEVFRITVFRQGCRIQREIINRTVDPVHVLAAMQSQLANIATGQSNGMVRIGDGNLSTQSTGIRPTHLPRLNDLLGGFAPGTLNIFCARTNVGKSAFLGSIALDVAVIQRIPVLLCDVEMGTDAALRRAICWLTGFDENATFKQGGYDRDLEIRKKVDEAHAIIKASPLYIVNIAGKTPEQVIAQMRQFRSCCVEASASKQGLIVYDYISAGASRIPEYQVLGDIAAGMRVVANELQIPILAGMQASREAMKMQHSDFADSGIGAASGSDRPAHHADTFMILRNITQSERQRVAERFGVVDAQHEGNRFRFNQILHVMKVRSGSTLEQGLPLHYQYGTARYAELAYQRDATGKVLIGADNRKMPSEEIQFLHSRDFQRKTTPTAKAGAVPMARVMQ
jgi:hypothetical protein